MLINRANTISLCSERRPESNPELIVQELVREEGDMSFRFIPTALIFLLSVGALSAPGQEVLKVPSQYKTIQSAINAANKGDTILVAPDAVHNGPYRENIDFMGKAIIVKSSNGPYETTIDGDQQGSVVSFKSGENRDSILEGFTITDGKGTYLGAGYKGLGIYCKSSSPTIRNNSIQNNRLLWSPDLGSFGGGIYCEGGSPLISGNVIRANKTNAIFFSQGGGIYCSFSSATIVNNIIVENRVQVGDDMATGLCYQEIYGGGGIWAQGSSDLIINNTIMENKVNKLPNVKEPSRGGGIHGGAAYNCIIRGNIAEIGTDVYLTGINYCHVGGADPKLVGYHLRYDSPCRDKGTNSIKGLPATDFEGDLRISYGTVDIGADEFFPRLFHTGNSTPGGTIQVKIIGDPGQIWYWALSSEVLNPPLFIPGYFGHLYLNPLNIVVIPIGVFPNTRESGFSYKFPANFPKILIPTQALMGTQLSNLNMVKVM